MLDITQPVLERSSLRAELEEINTKARSYPGVRSCEIEIDRIAGSRLDDGRFAIDIEATLKLATLLLPTITLKSRASGVLVTDDRALTFSSVEVTNDQTGLAIKLVNWLGFGAGRSVKIKRPDRDLIDSLL